MQTTVSAENNKFLEMVMILTAEYPACVREAKEMIVDGDIGMDLVKLIRRYTRLDLQSAVQYRKALIHCQDIL